MESGKLFDEFVLNQNGVLIQLFDSSNNEIELPSQSSSVFPVFVTSGVAIESDDPAAYRATHSYIFTFADSDEVYTLTIAGSAQEVDLLKDTLGGIFLVLLFVVLLVAVLASIVYSHYVTRPVLRISGVSRRMAQLDFSWKCKEGRTDELGTLAHSLNEMSQRLSASMADLKSANEKLQADIERERALEQAQLDFFSAVSHELKTPITVIKGQTEGMILNIGDYQDRNKYLMRSLEIINTMEGIVQEILTVSRMKSSKVGLKKENIQFSDMLKQEYALFEDLIIQKGIDWKENITPDLCVVGDKALLQKAINNLVSNAIAYPSSTNIKEGKLPQAPMELALPEDVLQYLGFDGNIGDTISLSLEKSLRHNIADSYSYTAEFVLTGILESNYLGYVSGTVTGVVGEGTAIQLLPQSHIYYNVDIRTADKSAFQSIVDDINGKLQIHELDTSYNMVYLNAMGISYTADSEDANDTGFSFMAVAGILVAFLILLAAGLVIYNILKISVSKRMKGYGTLRAIGGEKGQLYQIVVIEVILLCVIGIPVGMLLGSLSASGILAAATGLISPELFLVQNATELQALIAENSSLKVISLIISGAITLIFAMFAALPAARSAAKVSPIMAMSGTNLKIHRRKRRTRKIRNFEAYYARLNLKRNKGRTAITVLSLIMSITVFIALQGFTTILNAASALQESHLGDYQITNETVGFSADALRELQENESVQSVAAIQFSLYEQNEAGKPDGIDIGFALKPGETFQVIGLNDEYWDYFMGSELSADQLEELKSGNACVVRNPISVSYGEEPLEFTSIEAGSTICVAGADLAVLETLDGYEGYLGIGNGGFTNGVQVIVDDSIYEQLTGKNTYSEFLPTLNKDVDRETFDTFVEDFCKQTPGTTFLSYEETDQQLQESFAQIQMLAWGLILFVGLIGILNIINTVYTNIHTRVTEIGMQRAIGMSASSLYKTFLWEGAYYGITASVIGSILGYICTIFIEAATSDTIQLVAIPVVSILEATLLAVGACLLATAIPLRKISNMSIVDSIETIE